MYLYMVHGYMRVLLLSNSHDDPKTVLHFHVAGNISRIEKWYIYDTIYEKGASGDD